MALKVAAQHQDPADGSDEVSPLALSFSPPLILSVRMIGKIESTALDANPIANGMGNFSVFTCAVGAPDGFMKKFGCTATPGSQ